MKALYFLLFLSLISCSHAKKESSSFKKTSKVMVIDTGRLSLAAKDLNQIKFTEISQVISLSTTTPQGQDASSHGPDVMRVFEQTLAYLSPKSLKQVELVFCQIDAKTLDLSFCLEKAIEEKVSFLNISVTINSNITLREMLALHKLSSAGVIMTVAAGNDKTLVNKESLCGIQLANKFCVGGFDENLMLTTNSNFGPLINAYAPMKMAMVVGNSAKMISGTSFSSPYKLAQIVAFKLKNPLKSYDFHQENAMINKSARNIASK